MPRFHTLSIVATYSTEYRRVHGKNPLIEIRCAWVSVNGNKYRQTELTKFIQNLRQRPNFVSK